jgi:hypothetical protein
VRAREGASFDRGRDAPYLRSRISQRNVQMPAKRIRIHRYAHRYPVGKTG